MPVALQVKKVFSPFLLVRNFSVFFLFVQISYGGKGVMVTALKGRFCCSSLLLEASCIRTTLTKTPVPELTLNVRQRRITGTELVWQTELYI